MKKTIPTLILIIVLCHNVSAAGVTAAAVFEVENVLPIIELALYEDNGFSIARNGFNDNEQGYLKISITDANGHNDVKNVSVRFAGVNNNTEQILIDYTNTSFINAEGNKAEYFYAFNTLAGYNKYRLYVRTYDGNDQVISNIEFSQGNNIGITGAVVANSNREIVFEFFRNIMARIRQLF